jgi:hypothetical protein
LTVQAPAQQGLDISSDRGATAPAPAVLHKYVKLLLKGNERGVGVCGRSRQSDRRALGILNNLWKDISVDFSHQFVPRACTLRHP